MKNHTKVAREGKRSYRATITASSVVNGRTRADVKFFQLRIVLEKALEEYGRK